jgi:hypothetical protein
MRWWLSHEYLRVEDYMTSVSLFVWARNELGMPKREDIAAVAAEGGHLDVLEWLRAKEGRCAWPSSICDSAAGKGHLHVLEWLQTHIPQRDLKDERIRVAATQGIYIRVCHTRGIFSGCPVTQRTFYNAASSGHLHILQWLRALDWPLQNVQWDNTSCEIAARNGHLHVLQWLRAQDPPCPLGQTRAAGTYLLRSCERWSSRADAVDACPRSPA